MVSLQPVKSGISAPVVTSIPSQWDAQWFRRFITNYLQNADVRNTPGIVGATFANPPTPTVIATAIAVFTATTAGTVPASGGNPINFLNANGTWSVPVGVLPTIANNTVLGNVSGGAAQPVAISKTQLTTLVNVFSSSLSGAVPASGAGTAVNFLNAVGAYVVPPTFGTTSPGYVPAPGAVAGKFLSDNATWATVTVPVSANPSAKVGPTAVNGSAATFMTSDSAPAIDETVAYTWGAVHTFNARIAAAAGLTVTGASFVSRGITDSATATALTLAATGAISIAAPTSGNNAITINGAASAVAAVIISGLSGSTSGADVNIRRAGSTANQIQQGACLDLSDSTATTASAIQHSGGQFELWMTQNNGVTWTQAMKVTTVNGFVLGTPASGTTLIVSGAASAINIDAQSAEARVRLSSSSGKTYEWISGGGNAIVAGAFALFDVIRGAVPFVVNTSGGVSINTPASGDTLTLGPSATSGALVATSAALTNNAGALVGTLTNAPATGNPTKWIKINDNGTIRSIPAW